MMNITFQYTGQLAKAAGAHQEDVELQPGTPLKGAIETLTTRHGADYATLLLDDAGRLRPTLLVAIDDQQVAGDPAATDLSNARTVTLMTPIAGG